MVVSAAMLRLLPTKLRPAVSATEFIIGLPRVSSSVLT
jgi:hypothetical protein